MGKGVLVEIRKSFKDATWSAADEPLQARPPGQRPQDGLRAHQGEFIWLDKEKSESVAAEEEVCLTCLASCHCDPYQENGREFDD